LVGLVVGLGEGLIVGREVGFMVGLIGLDVGLGEGFMVGFGVAMGSVVGAASGFKVALTVGDEDVGSSTGAAPSASSHTAFIKHSMPLLVKKNSQHSSAE
jgi:hypothetical protein